LGRRWLGPFGGSGVSHISNKNNNLLSNTSHFAVKITNKYAPLCDMAPVVGSLNAHQY